MNTVLFTFEGGLYPLLGVLLFCAGTMLGIPHGLAKRSGDTKRTELWRVAHLSTCVGVFRLLHCRWRWSGCLVPPRHISWCRSVQARTAFFSPAR